MESTSIKLKKTGNFWLDIGLLGLALILEKIKTADFSSSKELKFELYKLDIGIEICTDSDEMIQRVMDIALEEVTQAYLTQKEGSIGWYYDETQNEFFIYPKKNWKPHMTFKGKKPDTVGSIYTKKEAEKKSKLSRNERVMKDEEEQMFYKFLSDNKLMLAKNALKQKEGWRVVAGKGLRNRAPIYKMKDRFEIDAMDSGEKICQFSGIRTKRINNVYGTNYPFVTGASGEINFNSFLKPTSSISSLYAFISMFSHYPLYYDRKDDSIFYFVVFDTDFLELYNFYQNIQTIQLIDHKQEYYCNFRKVLFNTNFVNESLLNFLLSIYKNTSRDLYRDKLFSKSIFYFSSEKGIFKTVQEFKKVAPLFSFFDQVEMSMTNSLVTLFNSFKKILKNRKEDSLYREKISEKILTFSDCHQIVEDFLFDVGLNEYENRIKFKHYIPYGKLNNFIIIYYKEVIDMEKNTLDLCFSLGNRIGNLCLAEENANRDVLYRLRNSKNLDEFLLVLEYAQYKLEGSSYSFNSKGGEKVKVENLLINKSLLEKIDEKNWQRFKSLISIFAMNSFLTGKSKAASNN